MLGFINKILNKPVAKKAEPKKPIPKERIESVVPAAKVEPPKLEVKKFTEAFISTEPMDQIDQIINFYNKFTNGKSFFVKQKISFSAAAPQLLLDQIYIVQEQYITHLKRLPFAEELRLSIWIGDEAKMREMVADRKEKLIKRTLELQAIGLEYPLVVNTEVKPKPIGTEIQSIEPKVLLTTPVSEKKENSKLEIKKFNEAYKSTDPAERVDQIIKFYNSFRPGKELFVKTKPVFTADSPDILLKQIYLVQQSYIDIFNRLPYAIELLWLTNVEGQDAMVRKLTDLEKYPQTKKSLADFALQQNLPFTVTGDSSAKTI